MARYAAPGTDGSVVTFKPRYDHFIGGEYVAPAKGQYFENPTPITGETFTEVARGTAEDVEKALDAAHAAAPAWGKTSAADRANVLNKMADRVEANLEQIAIAESWENGKACRETLAADIPLAVDHLRYFAGALRAQEGSLSEIDENTIAYHFHEPLGVVGQIIPWNFPILMAIWKLAPAIAAGNAVVLKPAEQTPASIHVLNELVADLLPPGVLNIVNGFGVEAGKPLASSKRIRKIAFTGETTTGRLIMQYASENLIPVTLELGGKSPNVFFDDVAAKQDEFYDKALEGFAMFALNQGEVCTCPSRALIQGGMYSDFLADGVKRVEQIKQGDPLDTDTMVGAQASNDQLEKILSYIDIGRQEGAKILAGGERSDLGGNLSGGYYMQPDDLRGRQLDAGLPGGDLRPGGVGGPVLRLRRRHQDRQRHALRPRRRRVEPRHQHRVPRGSRHPGRPGVGEQLPRLPRARGLRRLQAVGHRAREPQDDARPLPADEEHAGQLLAERARLLLMDPVGDGAVRTVFDTGRVALTPAAAELLVKMTEIHGPLMFHQSGGCCDGSAPMCYPDGDFKTGGSDVHLGDLRVDGLEKPIGFWMSSSQYEYWKHTHLTVDVVKGRGSGFSVEAPEGVRFLIRSRLFTDEEWVALQEH